MRWGSGKLPPTFHSHEMRARSECLIFWLTYRLRSDRLFLKTRHSSVFFSPPCSRRRWLPVTWLQSPPSSTIGIFNTPTVRCDCETLWEQILEIWSQACNAIRDRYISTSVFTSYFWYCAINILRERAYFAPHQSVLIWLNVCHVNQRNRAVKGIRRWCAQTPPQNIKNRYYWLKLWCCSSASFLFSNPSLGIITSFGFLWEFSVNLTRTGDLVSVVRGERCGEGVR